MTLDRWNTVVDYKHTPRPATPATPAGCSDGHVSQPEQLAAPHPRLLQRPPLPTAVAPVGVATLDAWPRTRSAVGKMFRHRTPSRENGACVRLRHLRRLGGLAPLVAVALGRIAPLSAPAEAPRAAGPLDRRHPGAQRRGERLALGAAGHLQLALHACAHRQHEQSARALHCHLWETVAAGVALLGGGVAAGAYVPW